MAHHGPRSPEETRLRRIAGMRGRRLALFALYVSEFQSWFRDLRPYVSHERGCEGSGDDDDSPPCSCGLDAVLARLPSPPPTRLDVRAVRLPPGKVTDAVQP